jgi:glycosyltransferase involved in cell wall biosynthesis
VRVESEGDGSVTIDENRAMPANGDASRGRTGRRFDVTFYAPAATGLFLPGAGPLPGGAETQQLILARELARRGYRVAMIVLGEPGSLPAERNGVRIVTQSAVQSRVPVLRSLLAIGQTLRSLRAARAHTYVRRGLSGVTGLLAATAKLSRARFVFSTASALDFLPEKWESDPKRVKLYEFGVRLADEVVVQTDAQADLCQKRFNREPRMIRSIAEESSPRSGIPDGFLWIGRVEENKRPDAYLALARALPMAHFRMIALPSPADNTGLAERLQLDAEPIPNLELSPPRPRAELQTLYESAAAIVSTSEYEGMPNVFLEAWARGVPALSLTYDPDGLVTKEGLGACANGSFERFVELASEIWEARTDGAALALRCRNYVAREHGLEANVDRWVDVLEIGA